MDWGGSRALRLSAALAVAAVALAIAGEPAGRAMGAQGRGTGMDDIARAYVKLVLGVGQHDPDYVDAYYGPPAIKAEADASKPALAHIESEAAALMGRLGNPPPERPDPLLRLRHRYLQRQLQSLVSRVQMLGGRRLTFDEESRALYDAVAPSIPESTFERTTERLEALLPGPGALVDRYEAYRRSFVIPREKLDVVFRAAIDACRERTRQHIALPDEERFTVEYVTGKSWSGYNWYQGGYRSLIQVNTDLPIYIDRAVDLACHEGYPGHHVYNALLEKHLVRDRGWVEFSVYALFSPQSLIAEGTANFGIEVAFPADRRVEFERASLFPLAGLDGSKAAEYYRIQALVDELSYAGNEAARRYLDGVITAEAAVSWLTRYALMARPRAEQRIKFFDQYRSYVINYNLGKDMVRRYIERRGGTADRPAKRWEEFGRLLSSPRLPSGLEE
jgi:hypothetical protein